jgi:hypothetical protein
LQRGDGIRAPGDCLILSNITCEARAGTGDGAGFAPSTRAIASRGNNVTANDRGIGWAAPAVLIIKNSASANTTTDYVIAASSRYGAINITDSGAAAVNGNAAAIPSSTDPWANFPG